MRTRIINILINPYIISLFISLIVIILLPPVFNKYKIDLIEQKMWGNIRIYYDDLDNDGLSEEIRFAPDFANRTGIIVLTKSKVVDQWNFPGKLRSIDSFIIGDYDHNGFKEIYLFTYQNDSIFLHGFEPLFSDSIHIYKKYITKYYAHDYTDFVISPGGVHDLNGDGSAEIVLSINTGFSRQPRNLFAYDIKNDISFSSPVSGIGINNLISFDINNDGFCEFMGKSVAPGNFDSEFPFTDQIGWLMVFNRKLEFLFKPVEIGPYTSQIQTIPYKPHDKTYLAVLFKYPGILDINSSLLLFNAEGVLLKKSEFDSYKDIERSFLISSNSKERNKLYLIHENGIAEQLDSNLKIIHTKKIERINSDKTLLIDLDNDKNEELLFWSLYNDKLIIARNDLSHPVVFEKSKSAITLCSVVLKGDEDPDFLIQCDDQYYLTHYSRNSLFYLKYMIYLGIYAGILILVLLIFRAQKYRLKQRYETVKKIAELQLKSIKNQIEPHFTLNTLNAIGSLFYKKDEEKANYLFGKYAKLLRLTILRSDNIEVPLYEEIDYIRNYLDLEKFRLDDKFEYEIVIDDIVNQGIILPKMLLHTFVENAIKHGLRHLKSKGNLKISINKTGNKYLINIIDNGIGRHNARQYAGQNTGKGLEIIDNILELYYNLFRKRISYKIIDIDKNKGGGTHIKISLPAGN